MRKAIFVIGLVFALSVSAMADSNQMAYQGRLTDAVGAPLGPDTVTVVFEIFDDSTAAANSVWIDTLVVNTDAQGVFTAILDGVQPAIGAVRYVELTVRGTTLSPRQPLTSAPYTLTTPFGAAVKKGTTGTTSLSTTQVALAQITVNFPANGYAMIICQSSFYTTTTSMYLSPVLYEGSLGGTYRDGWWWDAGDNDSWYDQHQSHTSVLPVTAGTHTYVLGISTSSGTASASGPAIIVAFFPSTL